MKEEKVSENMSTKDVAERILSNAIIYKEDNYVPEGFCGEYGYYKFDDLEDFNWFLEEVGRMAKIFISSEEVSEEVVDDVELEKEQSKRIKKEMKVIEKWYPGERNLEELESKLRGAYSSLHQFQYIVALHRRGDADIFRNDSGLLCVTQNE